MNKLGRSISSDLQGARGGSMSTTTSSHCKWCKQRIDSSEDTNFLWVHWETDERRCDSTAQPDYDYGDWQ